MVPDIVKIGYLRSTLNTEMQHAMIGPVTYTDYGRFVQALLAVGSQLDYLQKCWQEGRCFNCLKRGHRANNCLGTKGEIPNKTKKETTANTTKVNAVKKKDVVLVETEAIETFDSDKRVGK